MSCLSVLGCSEKSLYAFYCLAFCWIRNIFTLENFWFFGTKKKIVYFLEFVNKYLFIKQILPM